MDEIRPAEHPTRAASNANDDESLRRESRALPLDKRICIVGPLVSDSAVCSAAQSFGVSIITSETGWEYAEDKSCTTVFLTGAFEGDVYDTLCRSKHPILGPPAVQQIANKNERLPNNIRPLYNLAMAGAVVCFGGFRNKEDLAKLIPLVHHMGGSIRKDVSAKVTHLIGNVSGGYKYRYATTFRVPVMHLKWVLDSWEKRDDLSFKATSEGFMNDYKLKPFHGAKVCFLGFPEEEEKHMIDVLEANGGSKTTLDDPNCSHVVLDRAGALKPEVGSGSRTPKSSFNPTPQTLSRFETSLSSLASNTPCMATVHEQTTEMDDTLVSEAECSVRKFARKFAERDCYSEQTKRNRLTEIFRTPLSYLSGRRRSEYFGDSVLSSSGVFDVETVDNLSELAPDLSRAGVRKRLFGRAFSSAKFSKSVRAKKGLKLSFEDAGNERLNASCFPELSSTSSSSASSFSRRASECCEPFLADGNVDRSGRERAPVVDEGAVVDRPEVPSRAHIVKAEWFWTSVQKEMSLDERDYLCEEYVEQVLTPNSRRESHAGASSSASRRKRKRVPDALSALIHHQQSPGSFLDCTASPDKALLDGGDANADTPRKGLTARQQVFLELVQTESNYVNILNTINTMFKKHLEEMPEQEALLNNTELKIIFGNLPPIYETHLRMLDELRWMSANWSEDKSVGNVVLKYSTDLLKAYPPFVNFFEETKEMLAQCDAAKPRFHAFLKACQTRPECGRQTLQDLLIRPVQRLPSITLLLNDILKHTSKNNSDHAALEQALAAIREVMTHINEDKRKTEGQKVMFDIFNDIDNCPPDLLSSHRTFTTKLDVVQLSSSDGLSSKGNPLILFLFSDQLEVCKKRSKAFNSLKSPNPINGAHQKSSYKPYKHVRLMPLSTIKKVIDIKETEDCQKVFTLIFVSNEDGKERSFSFALTEESACKQLFLKTLCRQMANNACTPDADQFLVYLEPHHLNIDTSDVNSGTLSKAFKFATRTSLKVGRAFSFNKTPSKLKRAVSSMMSPFGSSTNLTPASQLAQMKLASCTNINELGHQLNSSEAQPVAPMSVQPSRKLKTSSMTIPSLKRL